MPYSKVPSGFFISPIVGAIPVTLKEVNNPGVLGKSNVVVSCDLYIIECVALSVLTDPPPRCVSTTEDQTSPKPLFGPSTKYCCKCGNDFRSGTLFLSNGSLLPNCFWSRSFSIFFLIAL